MFRRTRIVAIVVIGMGLFDSTEVLGQEKDSPPRVEENATRLRQVVQNAARQNQEYCNQFVIATVNEYLKDGETYSNEGTLKNVYSDLELDDLNADHQIDYMSVHWTKVDLHRAMKLANEGKLVVAGLKGQPGHHGHVAVVMPGGPDPVTHWPVVAGGGAEAARSITGKSMTQVWRHTLLHPRLQVEFFTPRSTPQTVTVDVKPMPDVKAAGKAERKGFTYKKDAPKQVGSLVGTWHQKGRPGILLTITADRMDWMESYVGTYTQKDNSFKAKLQQRNISDAFVEIDGKIDGNNIHIKAIRNYSTSFGRKSDDFGEYDYEK